MKCLVVQTDGLSQPVVDALVDCVRVWCESNGVDPDAHIGVIAPWSQIGTAAFLAQAFARAASVQDALAKVKGEP